MSEEKDLVVVDTEQRMLTVPGAQALQAFHDRKVPKAYIRTRKGPGGITLDYVSHGHVNEVLLQAFGPHGFNWEVLEATVLEDGSTIARGRLTVFGQWIVYNGQPIKGPDTIITELGSIPADTMIKPYAFKMASAASRALVRAVARLGYGLEFYLKEERAMDAQEQWEYLVDYAVDKLGGERREIAKLLGAYLREQGFEDMLKFADNTTSAKAYEATGTFIKERQREREKPTPYDEEETKEDAEAKEEPKAEAQEQDQQEKEVVLPKTIDEALAVPVVQHTQDNNVKKGDPVSKLLKHVGVDRIPDVLRYLANPAHKQGAALMAAAAILQANPALVKDRLGIVDEKLPF